MNFIVKRDIQRPTSLEKWEELYYYVDFNWEHIFQLPYLTATETSLQSMQYQIIHRFFPCNSTVHTC